MPADVPHLRKRRYEPRHATKEGPEFILARIAKLPTRRGPIRFRIWVALGLGVLALIGLPMWTRWVWERGLL
jgi:hypothetical protein